MVERVTCEACRILQAEVENDQGSKRPRRGTRYMVIRSS